MESATIVVFSIQLRAEMALMIEWKGEKLESPPGLDAAVHDVSALTEVALGGLKVSVPGLIA